MVQCNSESTSINHWDTRFFWVGSVWAKNNTMTDVSLLLLGTQVGKYLNMKTRMVMNLEKIEIKGCKGYGLGANSSVRKPEEAVNQLGIYWLVLNEPPPLF
jgi:hypothetical protein